MSDKMNHCKSCKFWIPALKDWRPDNFYDYFIEDIKYEFVDGESWEGKSWERGPYKQTGIYVDYPSSVKGISTEAIKKKLGESIESYISHRRFLENFRVCINPKFLGGSGNYPQNDQTDYVNYCEINNGDEGYGDGYQFLTGKDFGCVHFEKI